jgi:D-glycero-alpha-D-manno-heptose-7-phosphate kinase
MGDAVYHESLTTKILSQAPCRVDLAGGTLDIWPLYLFHDGAVSVNFAVDRWTRAAIHPRQDSRIVFRSTDLRREYAYASLEELLRDRRPALPLAAETARFFLPPTGLELTTGSDAPAGAGISGSSALIIAVASAFNRWLNRGYSIEKLREIAQNIEARIIGVPTGCQDYYPAMYGGVSAIELGCAGVARHKIDVDFKEMERRIVLAYTGAPRNSGINNWEVTKSHIDGSKTVQRNFARIAAIARAMRQALEGADWNEAGRLLREEWTHRRRNAPGISTPLIDRLVTATRRAGALGAKVCGAGGGGCVLFFTEPDARERVAGIVVREGATVLPVRIARHGVQTKVTDQPRAQTA